MLNLDKVWNPFRSPEKRAQFERFVRSYACRNAPLFYTQGGVVESSFNAHFWAGYNKWQGPLYQSESSAYRRSPSFVAYEAGRIIRKVESFTHCT
jgi:hypothetical protein